MNKIKELATQMAAKIRKALSTRKGKTYAGIGGCAVVAIVISALAINSIPTSASISNHRFRIDAASSSSSTGTASGSSGPVVSSGSTPSSTNSIPIVSAAPVPSGAAPTAAQAMQTIPVTSVDFNHRSLTLSVGATSQLTASITPGSASDKTLTWTSTNTGVATVDQSGTVKAVGTGTAYIRATNSDGQRDTCTVTVQGSTGNTGSGTGNGGGNAGGAPGTPTTNVPGHVANYQGINVTKSYTDEITGVQQTVQFLGVGAGYCEVAAGNADINTTPALGAAHGGFNATVSLIGSNGIHQGGSTAVVGTSGTCSGLVFGNLTAGTYTIQLTAHDGTVVARYHFSVDSGGNVA
ncbi:Ig-like domain-containing protein [Ethanoligenens harbinense]|uniref:Ig domain protein group 2 domain protein n=1 Tax=Ethanoligenens harbinense (strain DSM 18485 / JCM 12961 / CGMCC 1.5033 / YUAN-3) TaxID=663278 RepID=E6U5T8_ETHHY|nr:Ig-like domain-containing protein [Ethanoligenens harbinense]ADU27955.1 Ig domain protein group 2 domain protein [Ethanoligenens harbinense YUAN-3]